MIDVCNTLEPFYMTSLGPGWIDTLRNMLLSFFNLN